MKKFSSICLALLFIAGSLVAGSSDYVDFNDGETHIIDYHVQYSPEIPDCSVRVDYGVENDPGTELIFKTGSLVYHHVEALNNSSIVMEGGDVWGNIILRDSSSLTFHGGKAGISLNNNSTGVIQGGISNIHLNDSSSISIHNGTLLDYWSHYNTPQN